MKPKSLEQILENVKIEFTHMAERALSDVIGDYIPYLETDKIENVEHRTRDWLAAFFDGKLDEYIKCPMLSKFDCKQAREMVYQAHKDEIIKLIGMDKDEEIESLKMALAAGYKRY